MNWEERIKQKAREEEAAREEVEERRAAAAVETIEKHVGRLKEVLRGAGGRRRFGDLFHEMEKESAQLAGTLKTAQRLGVVGYETGHDSPLLMGRDDDVLITLLDTSDHTHFNILVHDKLLPPPPPHDPFLLPPSSDCYICHLPIIPLHRVGVANVSLHSSCFKCCVCNAPLTPSRYGSLDLDGVWHFYCLPHYRSNFKVGANYQTGFQHDAHAQYETLNSHSDRFA